MQIKYSVISPVYNGEATIEDLYLRLTKVLRQQKAPYEIVLVEDGGTDNSWQTIESLAHKDKHIKAIRLSRNFGQHNAITAGLEASLGQLVIVMDCDLEDKPEDIGKLTRKIAEGYDVVLAQREKRDDSPKKIFFSASFYHVFRFLANLKSNDPIVNFGIYTRQVIDEILRLKEQTRFFPTLRKWVGFKVGVIKVARSVNPKRNSSYTFTSLLNLAFNIIIAHSDKPMKIFIIFGAIVSSVSFLIGTTALFLHITNKISVAGWTSIIISMYFLCGLVFISLGLIGVYISKIYDEVKNRPLYIIRDRINL